MNCLDIKTKVNNAAIEHLEEIIAELRDEISTKLKGDGTTDEGGFAGNSGDYSAQASNNFLSEQASIRRSEAEQYQQVVNRLKGYQFNKELKIVEFLSLVKTNRGWFFINQAVKPLKVDGTKYFMITPEAPIYEVLKGKKAGDSYSFRGIDYTIESIC